MAIRTWIGGRGTWDNVNTANWADGIIPVAGDDVIFSAIAGVPLYTVTLAANTPALGSVSLNDDAGVTLVIGGFQLKANNLTDGTDVVSVGTGNTISMKTGGSITAGGLIVDGTLSGAGIITMQKVGNGTNTISGNGTIFASNGLLDLVGTVASGLDFAIDTSIFSGGTVNSELRFDGTAHIDPISITSNYQDLEIGAFGEVTISGEQVVGNGAIRMYGGELAVTGGVSFPDGVGGLITGYGKITGNITGSGAVDAYGGILELVSAIPVNNHVTFAVESKSVLQLDGTYSGSHTFALSGSNAELRLADRGTGGLSVWYWDVGLNGQGIDFVDIQGQALTITSVQYFGYSTDGYVGVINTSDGQSIQVSGVYSPWFANYGSDGNGGTSFWLSDTPCYCRGTLILTDRGEFPVQDLRIGDHVITFSGERLPIKWIGRRSYDGRFIQKNMAVLPIRIEAGALGDNTPTRDLFVSPEHALYLDGVLVPARLLLNGVTVRQVPTGDRLEYFHIELESHEVIFAEGTAAETFVDCDNRGMFQNAMEFAAHYPDDNRPTWDFFALRLTRDSRELRAIRGALLDRAGVLDRVTRDPDLHLVVNGEIVRAQSGARGVYRFELRAAVGTVVIASRNAVPAELEPASADIRQLGVAIERIVPCGTGLRTEIGPDYLVLTDGFHGTEASHRWTNGLGHLPPELLTPFGDNLIIEVHITDNALCYALDPLNSATAGVPYRAAV